MTSQQIDSLKPGDTFTFPEKKALILNGFILSPNLPGMYFPSHSSFISDNIIGEMVIVEFIDQGSIYFCKYGNISIKDSVSKSWLKLLFNSLPIKERKELKYCTCSAMLHSAVRSGTVSLTNAAHDTFCAYFRHGESNHTRIK